MQFLYKVHVMLYHDAHQFLERSLAGIPSQELFGFGGVAQELLYLGRAEVFGVYLYQYLAGSYIDTLLVDTFSFPTEFYAYLLECQRTELANRVVLAGSDNEIFGRLMLQDKPHALDIVFGIAPVAQRIEISQIELVLESLHDARRCKRDFTGHEVLTATLAFVIVS